MAISSAPKLSTIAAQWFRISWSSILASISFMRFRAAAFRFPRADTISSVLMRA